MKDKLFKGIILGTQLGTISIFAGLIYKLKNEQEKFKFSYENLNRIVPTIEQKYDDDVNFDNIKRLNFKKIVEKFYFRLLEDKNIDLTNFKKNINTLKFKNIKEYNNGKRTCAEALYDYYNNTIYYGVSTKLRIFAHELLHMASTIYDENNKNIRLMGFGQDINDQEIGMGLTEGYTELLAKRYFSYEDKSEISDSYIVETSFVNSLEKIVGKEKMTKLYFTADLKGLINELRQYNSLENIINFINYVDEISIDTTNASKYLSTKEYMDYVTNVVKFLISSYSNKLKYDIYTNKITNQQFYKKIEEFVNDLNISDYIYYGEKYTNQLLTRKNIFKVLKKMFKNHDISFEIYDESIKR